MHLRYLFLATIFSISVSGIYAQEVSTKKLFQKGYKLYQQNKIHESYKILNKAWHQGPKTRNLAQLFGWVALQLGNEYMSENKWDEAVHYYEKGIAVDKEFKLNLYTGYRALIEVATRRKAMGNFTPLHNHRVLVLYVKNSDFKVDWPKNEHIKTTLTERHIKQAKIGMNITKAFWEVGTRGKLSMSFDVIEWDGPIDQVEVATHRRTELPRWSPSLDRLSQKMGDKLWQKLDKIDTVLIIWSSKKPVRATGGKDTIKSPDGKSYVRKAVVQIPGERLNLYPAKLTIHEFFHIYEANQSIRPIHGFRFAQKHHFPKWSGKHELDYYLWHMAVYPETR